MIKVTFPDGAVRDFPRGTTGTTVVEGISSSLARKTVAMKVNGVLSDLADPINLDAAQPITLGRASRCDVQLPFATVSSQHFMIQPSGAGYQLTDLGSTNGTALNGARLPSPEPERKVVPLDLFPSGLLQSITTAKNFTPDLPGDFSGARVDIRTREFPASRQMSYSLGMGANLLATGKQVISAPTEGMEWLGLGGSDRQIPGIVQSFGNFAGQSPTQLETNAMVRSFRNAWRPQGTTGSPNMSGSVAMGGNDPLMGRDIGYLASLTYSRSQEMRDREIRAYPDATLQPDGGLREIDRFEGTTGRNSVLWGGLLNLSTMLGTSGRLQFNNSYTRTSDNEARRESGLSENLGRELFVDRLQFVSRSVRTNQLVGELADERPHVGDDAERLVLNLHRAYADAEGREMDVLQSMLDAMTWNGGPLTTHVCCGS